MENETDIIIKYENLFIDAAKKAVSELERYLVDDVKSLHRERCDATPKIVVHFILEEWPRIEDVLIDCHLCGKRWIEQ